jgi:mRNA interferase RelE/StbE
MVYEIEWTETALRLLKQISDRRIQSKLVERTEKLVQSPEKQGRALEGELWRLRSLRAIGQRYRIIFKIDSHKQKVFIIAVGIRKEKHKNDVYELAKKLIRAGI